EGEGATIPIGNVPAQFAGREINLSLFDPGDVVDCNHPGSAWIELQEPDGKSFADFTYTVTADETSNYLGDPNRNLAGVSMPTIRVAEGGGFSDNIYGTDSFTHTIALGNSTSYVTSSTVDHTTGLGYYYNSAQNKWLPATKGPALQVADN